MVTDPRDIDIPEGGDDVSNGYDTPPLIADDDDEPENSPPLTKDGIPWEARAPPTIVMVLKALEAIQGLLVVPHIPGKRKHTVLMKIDGWERRHLKEMSAFLGLYTDSESKTRGEWTASSVQAAVSHNKGKGGRHRHARSIRERACKYIFAREVPVCPLCIQCCFCEFINMFSG
jgi:hypothetical protein